MLLFTIKIHATIPPAAGDLKGEIIDKLTDDAMEQIHLGLEAVIERVAPMFPQLRFTVTE